MSKRPVFVFAMLASMNAAQARGQGDPAYTSGRPSLCRVSPPAGTPLMARHVDAGIVEMGLRVERTQSWIAPATGASSGALSLCAEYGRIEIMDSDDESVRVQVRTSTYGGAARKAVEDTPVEVRMTQHEGVLHIAVWHTKQGFAASVNPAGVSIRLQVPAALRYRVDALANHGGVGVHNLVLSGGRIEGLVGAKMRGIAGYQGGHDLFATLAGDLEVVLAGGIRGSGSVTGSITLLSSSRLNIRTDDGIVRLAIEPNPSVGIMARARSREGVLRVVLDPPGAIPAPGSAALQPRPQTGGEVERQSTNYAAAQRRIDVTVESTSGNIEIVSAN